MAKRALIHFIAECTVCDWTTEDYVHGPRKASRHAARTGHRVNAEAGYSVKYGKPPVRDSSDEKER